MGIFEPVRQRDGTGSREEARDDRRRLAGAHNRENHGSSTTPDAAGESRVAAEPARLRAVVSGGIARHRGVDHKRVR
jgi:hypothetical protein